MAQGRGRSRRGGRRRCGTHRPTRWWWGALVVGLAAVVGYVFYLDHRVTSHFEGKRWALPARVFARPLELYPGKAYTAEQLVAELEALRYRSASRPRAPGTFARRGARFEIVSRAFAFWDGVEPSIRFVVRLDGGRVASLARAGGGALPLVRLDPVHIGGIYPAHREDRLLVRLEEVPDLLVEGLIAVEDRRFRRHHGLDPEAIGRALLANLRAGGIVQGGSTLTQQLVKNFYLSEARTLWRKANEAVMAVLLDARYDKDAILEAYLNEVYLGQDRARAVHGFGLASRFYFDAPLEALELHQIALLAALVKGPGHYDPRRHPERARARRDLVLEVMAEQGVIGARAARAARARPLDVTSSARAALTEYPAFVALVRRQLRRDYRDADLASEGLRIFTTLDPSVQARAESALARRLPALERARGLEAGSLQGAVVVTAAQSGEVLAVVGGRDPRFEGFNRALDARRPVGSLIKPAVYLAALERPGAYTAATVLEDAPLTVELAGDREWRPGNYDGGYRGEVALYEALVDSRNVPTVRLGMDLGLERVTDTLARLGVERPLKAYPSLLLGAAALSPIEVAQVYQTLATGGFRTPLRAVREVLTPADEPLERYPLDVRQAFDPAPVYVLDHILQRVVREGTAQGLERWLDPGLGVAGKTGTTDELRDSWFAGFTGDRLGVVWVGLDDNRPTGLTGASGALEVWGALMRGLAPKPLALPEPDGVEWAWVAPDTGRRAEAGCEEAVRLPFVRGSVPAERDPCAGGADPVRRGLDWLRRLFD